MSAGCASVRECRRERLSDLRVPKQGDLLADAAHEGQAQRLPSQTASARPSTSRASSMRPERWSTARVAVRRVSNATKRAYRGFSREHSTVTPRVSRMPRWIHAYVVGSRAGDGEVASLRREATPARLGGGKTVHNPIPRPMKPPMAERARIRPKPLASPTEMTADDLVRVADESFIAFFLPETRPACPRRRDARGRIDLLVRHTDLPLSGFNGCVGNEGSVIRRARRFAGMGGRTVERLPFRVWVAEKLAAGLAEVLSSYALEPAASLYPGMVLHPIPDPLALSPGVSIVSVREPSLEEFTGILEESGVWFDVA